MDKKDLYIGKPVVLKEKIKLVHTRTRKPLSFYHFIILSFSCFFFLSISAVSAQTTLLERPEIHIGMSHGATASQLMFDPSVRQDFLPGYNGGFTFRYTTEAGRALQVELNYSQRGWTERHNLYARRLNYIEMPFLMHYVLLGNERLSLFGNVGPKISYLLSEQVLHDNTENPTNERHLNNIANHFDYGLTGGIGLQFTANRQIFLLEVRANYSLSTTFPSDRRHFYNLSNNMNAALNLAWLMQINRR